MGKPAGVLCPGPFGRRQILHAGLAGLCGLGLGDLLRLRAEATEAGSSPHETACIFVWQDGGPSHLETYDLKPEAPAEYRGQFVPIPTRIPGMDICELLPRHAQVADKFTLIRSCTHESGFHGDGAQLILTGRSSPTERPVGQRYPDVGSLFKWGRPPVWNGMPSYVALPQRQYVNGAGYLGMKYEPFEVRANPNKPNFQVANLSLPAIVLDRCHDRMTLLRHFDQMRRDLDGRGVMEAMDSYNQEAMQLLTGGKVGQAFDLSHIDPRERDRYGRSTFGQTLLLARRLVEAGVGFVHVDGRDFTDVARCGDVCPDWDDHGTNCHIFEVMQKRLPWYDQALTALIEDLYQRGLDKKVLLVVTGEFGRTPRIISQRSHITKTMQPGRDHWPNAMSILVSGGNLRMGQVIGSTTTKGEGPKDRPLRPADLLATVYDFLGIDTAHEYVDPNGRPLAILPDGAPIPELVG
ncbi:MAG: DUF1501 domain-containing protein [Planctomycetaceae bacterium]